MHWVLFGMCAEALLSVRNTPRLVVAPAKSPTPLNFNASMHESCCGKDPGIGATQRQWGPRWEQAPWEQRHCAESLWKWEDLEPSGKPSKNAGTACSTLQAWSKTPIVSTRMRSHATYVPSSQGFLCPSALGKRMYNEEIHSKSAEMQCWPVSTRAVLGRDSRCSAYGRWCTDVNPATQRRWTYKVLHKPHTPVQQQSSGSSRFQTASLAFQHRSNSSEHKCELVPTLPWSKSTWKLLEANRPKQDKAATSRMCSKRALGRSKCLLVKLSRGPDCRKWSQQSMKKSQKPTPQSPTCATSICRFSSDLSVAWHLEMSPVGRGMLGTNREVRIQLESWRVARGLKRNRPLQRKQWLSAASLMPDATACGPFLCPFRPVLVHPWTSRSSLRLVLALSLPCVCPRSRSFPPPGIRPTPGRQEHLQSPLLLWMLKHLTALPASLSLASHHSM